MKKWYELLKDANVKKTQYLISVDDLQTFEIDNNVSLPEEYKEFCQVFGSGVFGNEIKIYCPPAIEYTHNVVAILGSGLEFLKQTNQISIHRAEHIARLFKNALIFGCTSSSSYFLWSLTAENSDDCENIYMVNLDSFECEGGEIEIVCKSFYKFIKDIALKNEPYSGVMSKYHYPNEMFESEFIPVLSNKTEMDSVVECLVINYPTEMAEWLLGSDQKLISVDASEKLSKSNKVSALILRMEDIILQISEFIPVLSNKTAVDSFFEMLVENDPTEMAEWILGNYQELISVDALERYGVNALILKTEDIILQIDVRTRLDSNIPSQFFNDYLPLCNIFPNKDIRQVIIYLKPTISPLVHITSYETSDTKHDFDVIRLWEQPTDFFLKNNVLMILAILSNTPNKQETLRYVAKIIDNMEENIAGGVSIEAAILARLVLDNESINQILRLD
jgi:predicted transposase YdaD